MALDSIDLTLGASTTAMGGVVAMTPDPNTNIIALAVQIVGVVSLLLKHRSERRARRKASSTKN